MQTIMPGERCKSNRPWRRNLQRLDVTVIKETSPVIVDTELHITRKDGRDFQQDIRHLAVTVTQPLTIQVPHDGIN